MQANDTLAGVLDRLHCHHGLVGAMVVNDGGNIIGSTFNESSSVAENIDKLMALANNARTVIRDLDPSDKLFCVRMRTEKKQELILMPEKDVLLVVMQDVGEPEAQ